MASFNISSIALFHMEVGIIEDGLFHLDLPDLKSLKLCGWEQKLGESLICFVMIRCNGAILVPSNSCFREREIEMCMEPSLHVECRCVFFGKFGIRGFWKIFCVVEGVF